MNSVIKRNGDKVPFDSQKIYSAVLKAFNEMLPDCEEDNIVHAKMIAEDVCGKMSGEEISVEQIQDMVENSLMHWFPDIARAYIRYRYKRQTIRDTYNDLDNEIQGLKDLTSEEVRNNANKSGDKLQTLRPMISDITCINYAKRHIVPEHISEHHGKEIYIHDYNYLLTPFFNCCLVNWEDCFEHGMCVGSAPIVKPKSISTAIALISQLAAHVSSNCYGGITFINLTTGLCQYGIASLNKHREVGRKWLKSEDEVEAYAWEQLETEIKNSAQSLEYEIQTLTNSRGEVPFNTIELNCIDLNASEEDQRVQYLIITSILKQRLKGLTGGVTPVFPKICFELKKGNNLDETDKYYDVFKLAVKCSSLRLYPDYLMHDKLVEVTGGYKAPMGCVDGSEVVTYKFNGNTFTESFKRMWKHLSNYYNVERQPNGKDLFIDTPNVQIYDTVNGFVENYRIIRNESDNWVRLNFSNGRTLTCTTDHPFETENRGVVFAKDLTEKDIIRINKDAITTTDTEIKYDEDKAWFLGVVLCDGCYDKVLDISLGSVNEDDIINRCAEILKSKYSLNTKIVDYTNVPRRNYKVVRALSNGTNDYIELLNYFISEFGGIKKLDRQIPNEVFLWNKESRYAFLAGMIDADGYINNSKTLRVQLGSTNKELALQQSYLAQSLGMRSSIYLNHYDKTNSEKIRYRVEFEPDEELMTYITCEKKKFHSNNWIRKNASISSTDYCTLTGKEVLNRKAFSYDVTTASEHFEVSGIYSHNCRSFIPELSDENGNRVTGGAFNQGVCSINLVRLAILSNHDEAKFYNLLDKYLDMAREMLMIRHNALKEVKAKQAPILYQYGAIARLDPEDSIESLLYKNRSTISIGYVGIHNALIALYGKSYDTDSTMIEKGKQILQHMRDYCDTLKASTNLGFSLYSTPAETLATKFCKRDIQDFGVIEGVNDKGYYENSFHYPSDESVHPFDKIDIESQMSGIPSGGAIQYVEFGNMIHNTDALETIIKYAYDKCHYFGVNVSSDRCFECGYVGEMISTDETNNCYKCPQCGNTDNTKMSVIRRLCGYLGSLSERKSVDNKMKEINHRVKHFNDGDCV